MGYILVGRKKGTKGKFKSMGPYEYSKKSQFGSLAKLKRDNLGWELVIIDKQLHGKV